MSLLRRAAQGAPLLPAGRRCVFYGELVCSKAMGMSGTSLQMGSTAGEIGKFRSQRVQVYLWSFIGGGRRGVHGFGRRGACWESLMRWLAEDPWENMGRNELAESWC